MEIKKGSVPAAILLIGAIFLAGCNTLKGAATGAVSAVGATAEGAAEDVKTAGNWIQRADDWMRKNLW